MPEEGNTLSKRFSARDVYQAAPGSTYQLLPFRFVSLDDERYVLSNFAGEYVVLLRDVLRQLVAKKLNRRSPVYSTLKARHFLLDGDSTIALDLLAAQYRTQQVSLSEFTSLHLFIPTLRCDHTCSYCQVSRQSHDKMAYDMDQEVADAAIDFMFRTPSPYVKVEFQGGEPLLNFELVRYIVQSVEERNAAQGKALEFVICTNLSPLTDDMLPFCQDHDIYISTSLDGPAFVHNQYRRGPCGDAYERVTRGIAQVRQALGPDRIAALMTTTKLSLSHPEAIVDEYIRQGFRSIFLRELHPYGFAVKTGAASAYTIDDWLAFYRRALAYILSLNYAGVEFREDYSALILQKMLTTGGTRFVDLRSPSAIGIGVILFNYDGNVYVSDEARMLAEMGDRTFCLGHLRSNSYEEVMLAEPLVASIRDTMAEGVPACADCGIQPFCGSDPVRHYRMQGDQVGNKAMSDFCKKSMGVTRHLIHLLEDDPDAAAVLRNWI